ncbi:MAG: SAM-dependent methyltransferase [Trueperaceae bacterium]|nr:SAM-dependent methyltransferase [Trueperaceae bacterium]
MNPPGAAAAHDAGDHTGDPPRLVVGRSPLIDVVRWIRAELAAGTERFELDIPDPDIPDPDIPDPDVPDPDVPDPERADGSAGAVGAAVLWPGAPRADGAPQRSWRAWADLADVLHCTMHTPRIVARGVVRVPFSRLGPEAPWHGGTSGRDRYARADGFSSVRKLEHPGFLLPLLEALERARPPDGSRVLVLGCHHGDEIEALDLLEPPPRRLRVVGVDHAAAPLAVAARRYPAAEFLECDVAHLPAGMGRFALVIAIDVVQGPAVDAPALLRRLVQDHLEPAAALVIGLPNSRFRGGDVVWGARTLNRRESDLSLVVKDLAAARRYLHQHGFRTHVGGRYDLLLSAWRERVHPSG